MDGYPSGSLGHNVPLIVASGLSSEPAELSLPAELRSQGILLRSELPPLEGREVNFLEAYFEEIDDHGSSWTAVTRGEPYRLRIKTVGRSFLLPPRRAPLPKSNSTPILHSPFSPLSPSSTLYPDGLIDARWVEKHQELLPSVFVCFYSLSSDPTTTTLHDNRLRTDINGIKGGLARSGYKTRLAVIILGDDEKSSALSADIIQERLDTIRRGTGLDPKSIFYIPYPESPIELKRVMNSILSVLYSTAVEYYRDLGRHAKKKRSRGIAPQPTIPPTSGTSQTLALPDWNFRYDFKSAVFAEFRQEMDAAIRSFEQAYEILLGQDVLDIIPSWSPRWNEARLLADVISIRCLRLHLWIGQTSLAVRRWQAHRDRVGDFVDRRGRGTNNYGWQAWEARWATVMAILMERVEIPGLTPSAATIFLGPEKAVLGERLQPWELLHHTGYWYRMAARHLAARRILAHMISEEDRRAPDDAPASPVASKAYMYDTYLCPPPHQEYPLHGDGVNHAQLIIDCLIQAQTQFQARKQHRIAAELSLECAREMATLESWQEVVSVLRPLWEDTPFRSERWLDISEEILWLLRRAAAKMGRADLVVAIDWELMDKRFTRRPHWHYDLGKCLDGVALESKPSVSISDDVISSFVSATFVFRSKESKAGETSLAQLSLKSDALQVGVPVTLSSIEVQFEGSLKTIILEHDSAAGVASSTKNAVSVWAVSLTEDFQRDADEDDDEQEPPLRGKCDLTLRPGQRRVFEMSIPLRESGPAEASSVVLSYRNEAFDLDYTLKLRATDQVMGWFIRGSAKPRLSRLEGRILQVQPRPPKMKLKLVESLEQYYANEPVVLRVSLLNEEEEEANVKVDVNIVGTAAPPFGVEAGEQRRDLEALAEETRATGLAFRRLNSSSSLDLLVRIDAAPAPTAYEVQIRAVYHLESDAATSIVQVLRMHVNVVNAFEANYDLVPRLHLEPWPSLFDYEGLQDEVESDKGLAQARGLTQQWSLLCHYASFAVEDLDVVGVDMTIKSATGDGRCNVMRRPKVSEGGIVVAPKTMHEAQFDLVVRKVSLGNRHSVAIDLAFVIHWRRRRHGDTETGGADINTTTMAAGEYLVLGTEPRVLASVLHSPPEMSGLVQLDVTIENPSNHLLTFGLTMEPSNAFAFSGAKQTTMSLLPMSRRTRTYRLLPFARGVYIRPGLVVRDKYFQKVLRIMPTEGMKMEKDGLLLWVPPAPAASKREPESEPESEGSETEPEQQETAVTMQ